jgi:peptidyl-prolyl cis-trans isomerase A (cyclophilin A)
MRYAIYPFVLLLFFQFNVNARPRKTGEILLLRTELGDIHIRVDFKHAPVTAANFLRYADAGLFDSACFYRVVRLDNQPANPVKIEVIQGGRYEKEDKGFPPVLHETTKLTRLRHRNGTISMARNQPGSATSEFFICVGDQPELDFGGKRNPDGQGFAAFGKVTEGMEVVRKIHSLQAPGQYLIKPVVIYKISRVEE